MGEDRKQTDVELWTIDECAQWFRVSPDALRCRMKRGQFPRATYVHFGRAVRFIAARVKEWLLKQAA